MRVVPGNAKLVAEYYGKQLPPTIRAQFILNDDDKPIGVVGFIRKSANVMIIFSEGTEEVFRYKKLILKLGKYMLAVADQNGWTLIADADDDKETADRFLTHLGFKRNEDGGYIRWPAQSRISALLSP